MVRLIYQIITQDLFSIDSFQIIFLDLDKANCVGVRLGDVFKKIIVVFKNMYGNKGL